MLVLGHAGIAAGVARSFDARADLRRVAFAALLPDLIDKPIFLLFPEFANGWSRTVCHGATGLAVFAALAVGLRFRSAKWQVAAWALHLALDRMWEEPTIALWPWLGWRLPPNPLAYLDRLWAKLTSPWVMGGELAGLLIIVWLWRRGGLSDRERRAAFGATGELPFVR